MLKKLLPYTALIVSMLLLITAVIDAFSAITLFETLLFRIAVVAMLLLSFGVTILSCFSAEMRRPLILLAGLLQTPIGGGMALVLVYDFCYPDQLQMDALLPLITILVAFASAIQSAVLLLCKSIEADEEMTDADDMIDRPTADDLRPSAPKRQTKVASPRPVSLDLDMDDDLSPISRKKQRYTATDLQVSGESLSQESSEQSVSFTSIDLFSLLSEEGVAEESTKSDTVAEEIPPLMGEESVSLMEESSEEVSAQATPFEETAEPAAEESSAPAPVDAEQSSAETMQTDPVRSDS